MSNQLTIQDRAKAQFMEVCGMKRLNAIVGEDNSANFLSDFITLAEQNPKANFGELAKCCIEIANMKLPITKQAGQAYVVPRNTTINKGTPDERKISVLNVEIGYKGWLVLAKRAGIAVRVYPIFKGDDYTYEINGFEQNFTYKPNINNILAEKTEQFIENNLQFIAVATKDLISKVETCDLVEIALLKKLRSKTQSKSGGVYKDWLLEMYKAKAIKYVLKKMPIDTLDSSIFRAFEKDDANDVSYVENTQAITQAPEQKSNPYASAMVTPQQQPQAPQSEIIDAQYGDATIPTINIENL